MNKMGNLLVRSKWLALLALTACSGISQGGESAGGAGAGGSAGRAERINEAGAAGVHVGGAGGTSGHPVAAAGQAGETVAEAGQPSDAGAGGEAGAVVAEGGSGGTNSTAGASGSGGAGGGVAPGCEPQDTHALPLRCAATQPTNCELATAPAGYCTGTGACPEANENGKQCFPLVDVDHALCGDGRIATCDIGTCGTDAGFKCNIYENTLPTAFCPCVRLGVIVAN